MRPAIIHFAGLAHGLEPFIDGLSEIVGFLISGDGALGEG